MSKLSNHKCENLIRCPHGLRGAKKGSPIPPGTDKRLARAFYGARGRCFYKTPRNLKSYIGRGIKFLLTFDELHRIWDRDMASKMKKPSLHRINSFGNYEFKNCKFIEWEKHIRLKHGEK